MQQWIVRQTFDTNCFMASFAGIFLAYNIIVDGVIRFEYLFETNMQCCEIKLINSCSSR